MGFVADDDDDDDTFCLDQFIIRYIFYKVVMAWFAQPRSMYLVTLSFRVL